jgi:hypothetical protein
MGGTDVLRNLERFLDAILAFEQERALQAYPPTGRIGALGACEQVLGGREIAQSRCGSALQRQQFGGMLGRCTMIFLPRTQ